MSNIFLSEDEFERIFKSHLKIETYSKSIESLFSPRMLNRIDYKPYYQRNYVWDKHKASYFIESILLGTEIPPLIFFNNGESIEVIDGRQRFETINRFKDNKFSLTQKGLASLKQLAKTPYDQLSKYSSTIIDDFLDAKLRIIEFEIVNEPKLDQNLEDKIKKEIFARYNSGITPLKRAEVDNAVYDSEPISTYLKNKFRNDKQLASKIYKLFFKYNVAKLDDPPIETILQFIRRHLVLYLMPIKYYARGTGRTEILSKLFDLLSDKTGDEEQLCQNFFNIIDLAERFNKYFNSISQTNRLTNECFLWATSVIINESKKNEITNDFISGFSAYLNDNLDKFEYVDSHYYKNIMARYNCTAEYIAKNFDFNIWLYVNGSTEKQNELKVMRKHEDTITKLNELETLRVTKPDPARESIDDLVIKMNRRRFIVRPSYQRNEVVNLTKASSIIESIILGIKLPALFIYKRNDGVAEVIDGQQRILTILGFIGESYIDAEGKTIITKNHKFSLRTPRILKDLKGKKFEDFDDKLKNKILDFELFIVEIEEKLNPDFNPVDLFIRLNDKPFPIKEHSFEMWNSWVIRDVIIPVKDGVNKHSGWFYLRSLKNENSRDRMLNEELYISIAYLFYKSIINEQDEIIPVDTYQKTDRINARIKQKKDITQVLLSISSSEDLKTTFLSCIKKVERFISNIKAILLDNDIQKNELDNFLNTEIEKIFKAASQRRYYIRTMQDYYILWLLLSNINSTMIKHHRVNMKKEITDFFCYLKNIPKEDTLDNKGHDKFANFIKNFHNKYRKDERKIVLSDSDKKTLLSIQKNKCSISGAPLFIGDDIEVDHVKPLAVGGKDSLSNLAITHKEFNRKKGGGFK